MKTKKVFFSIIFAVAILLFACSDDKNNSGPGTLSITMTDAPFPFEMIDEANVTISKIEVRNADSIADGESPFLVLKEEDMHFNLVNLVNGATEALVMIEVPSGNYDLVRLYIKDAVVKLSDGRELDLKVPSGAQTGIKVFVKPSIRVAGGLSSDLLLDFDLGRSFIPTGNVHSVNGITGFNFKPVIKAVNLSTTGTLIGIVGDTLSNPVKGAEIALYAADTLNTTTYTDSLGNYTVLGLLAGNYKITVTNDRYISQDDMVEIVEGNYTTKDFVLEPEPVGQ